MKNTLFATDDAHQLMQIKEEPCSFSSVFMWLATRAHEMQQHLLEGRRIPIIIFTML